MKELRKDGYNGSYATLNRYLKVNFSNLIAANKRFNPFKNIKSKNLRNYKRSIRFETDPGEQAQVDWGSFGRISVNNREERLYAFVLILSYSRVPYIEFVIKQNLPTLIQCHINAFRNLGIPKQIVYDNMKTVVIRRDRLPKGLDVIHYKPEFLDFAKHVLRTGKGNWVLEEKHYIKKIVNKKRVRLKRKAEIIVEVRPLNYYNRLIGA